MNRLFSKPTRPTLPATNGRSASGATIANRSVRAAPRETPEDRETAPAPSHPAEGPPSAETIGVRRPRWTMEDLVLPAEARRQFAQLLSRIRNHDLIYHQWQLSRIDPAAACRTINLYGPPGTGKSMAAEALAHTLGRPFLCVSYAELESKYVGETPKNIRAAFAAAERTGAVLFFDEADALLGRRLTDVSQAADHAVNLTRAVLLKQLDACEGVVVFATNLARNFDEAFVRRILMHVEIPLPDSAGRLRLWQAFIRDVVPGREDLDWPALVAHSAGMSGGELKNAVVIALSQLADGFREGDQLTDAQVLSAIDQVRRAKRDVGCTAAEPVTAELCHELSTKA